MTSSDKFGIAIAGILTFGVLTVCFLLAGHSERQDRQVQDMISRGVDPIKARCAIHGSAHEREFAVCLEAAKR